MITPGPGNAQHGHFYPPDALASAVSVFDGARCFTDHPSKTEEQDRPERTVHELCGWFANVHVGQDGALLASSVFDGAAADTARKTVEATMRYQKQYPDRVWAGYSINADGDWHPETTERLIQQYPQYRDKLSQREVWNVIDNFTQAMSVDLVTFPARGGKVLSITEAESMLSAQCWQVRMREAQKVTGALLMERGQRAPTDTEAMTDLVRGVRGLCEAAAGDDIITDLRRKADAVESTHKPETIATLLAALRAYLGEEQREEDDTAGAKQEDHKTKRAGTQEGETSMATEAMEAKGGTCEACGRKMEAATEAATESTQEAATEAAAKEDDGDDDSMAESTKKTAAAAAAATAAAAAADQDEDEDAAKQESDTPSTSFREASSRVAQLRGEGKMTEADRVELAALRIEREQRVKRANAEKAIREAGVEGMIDADKLMPFSESQWGTLISVASQSAPPPRSYGGGAINMPAPEARRTSVSPIDAFNAAYESARGL